MKFMEEKIVRGTHFGENTYRRISIFDGLYTTGFKIVEFNIAPVNLKASANDFVAKLVTINTPVAELQDGALWNWEDNREVAWATAENRVAFSNPFYRSIIDESAIIIEDLFFTYGVPGADFDVNYYIKLHKFELEPFVGTASIVKNMSYGE